MRRTFLAVAVLALLAVCAAGCGPAAEDGFKADEPVTSTLARPETSAEAAVGEAGTTTSTAATPEVSFVAPRGSGAGHIGYVEDPGVTWGPTSFCVLPDKSVAILDCGEECIQIFTHSGEPLRSIDLDGITVSPVDVQWWNDCFAILEFSSQPKSVLLIELDGSLRKRIDLWSGMDETAEGGLRIGQNGELGLMEPLASIHVLTDADGNPLPPTEMYQNTRKPAFRGGPEFELAYSSDGPLKGRLVGSTEWLPLVPGDAVGGTPIASDDAGNTYLRAARMMYDLSGNYVGGDTFVVKLDPALRQVGFAPIDGEGRVISPPRMVDVTADGNVYSMVPKADGVHIDTLHFSSTLPELVPGIQSTEAASILISGPAAIERPRGAELFRKGWGSRPGEVGHDVWEQGAPSQNNIEVAASPDGTTIAVLDYANARVELFGRDGTLERAIPIPATSVLDSLVYDRDGTLFLLAGDSALQLLAGAEQFTPSSVGWGDWVHGPTAEDDSLTCEVVLHEYGSWVVVLADDAAKSLRNVALAAAQLPLDAVRLLGRDYAGNFFIMARIYKEGWEGTESWCFVGISPQGDYLGQVRLPLDSWAGGGYAITPGGKVLELRSTEAGIVVTEFELRHEQL